MTNRSKTKLLIQTIFCRKSGEKIHTLDKLK